MTVPEVIDPDRVLALHYAGKLRPALSALWALDEALGRIVATTTQPLIGQMRLTWWHAALCALDDGDVPAEPLLAALYAHVLRDDVTGTRLAGLIDGWEVLLEPELTDSDLWAHANDRGSCLFAMSAVVLGGDAGAEGGRCWALADFARHCANREAARRALALADPAVTLGGMAKPLRVLTWLARYDVHRGKDQGINQPRPRSTILRAALA